MRIEYTYDTEDVSEIVIDVCATCKEVLEDDTFFTELASMNEALINTLICKFMPQMPLAKKIDVSTLFKEMLVGHLAAYEGTRIDTFPLRDEWKNE